MSFLPHWLTSSAKPTVYVYVYVYICDVYIKSTVIAFKGSKFIDPKKKKGCTGKHLELVMIYNTDDGV